MAAEASPHPASTTCPVKVMRAHSKHILTCFLEKGCYWFISCACVQIFRWISKLLSWDSEQYWFPHSIWVISPDFTPLRGQVRDHPFCLVQEQRYQTVHKTHRIPTRTWAHVYIHSAHIHVLCSFPLGARVKFLDWKREQGLVLSLTKTLHRRSAP